MSVPGSIFNPNCAATNRFIKEGAVCVNSANDILENLGFDVEYEKIKRTDRQLVNLSEREKLILISYRSSCDIDTVSKETKIPVQEINTSISRFELMDLL
jgi:predicted Rossmann fold nucleotide-binding protein DprA/Smf involved in DNA uptake